MKEIDEQIVSEWMKRLSERTEEPLNMPAPGLILFKADLIEKRRRTERAVMPVVWMHATALAVFGIAVLWLLLSGRSPIGGLFRETLASLVSIVPFLVLGAIAAATICAAFAFVLRRT